MRKTNIYSNRFPRKLKKEIIKMFDYPTYRRLLKSRVHIQLKCLCKLVEDKWKTDVFEWGLFFDTRN